MTYRFKKLFFYKCDHCGKERQTQKEEKAQQERPICPKCKATAVSKDQQSLFGDIPVDRVEKL